MTDKKTTKKATAPKKATTAKKRKTPVKKAEENKVQEQVVELGNKKEAVKVKEVKKSETIIIRR